MPRKGIEMDNKKKLLVYAHYYTPDVASTGQILKELTEGMLDLFDITVICVVPSYTGKIEAKYKEKKFYKENINGVKVLRIRVPEFSKSSKITRIKNILGYFFGAILATFKVGDQDYIFSISQPPVLGGLLGVCGKIVKRAKYIYNIQDFNPEQIIAVGYSRNKFVLNAMMFFDKLSCRSSDLVITVGRDLVQTMQKRFANGKMPKTVMVNNWIDEKQVYPLAFDDQGVIAFRKKFDLHNKFVFMYSGNLGLYYDLENIFKVIKKIPSGTMTKDGKEVVFAFVGAGSIQDKLETYAKKHKMNHVVFLPYQRKEDLIYSLNAADVHWCINAEGIKGVSCPSKYYGIAAVAKPILAVLERDTEIRLLLEETRGGLVSDPGDYVSIENNIRWFINNCEDNELNEMGKRSRENLCNSLTKEISITKYKQNILEI